MKKSPRLSMIIWLTLYIAWLFSTTGFHPTWALRIACTSILVLASAVFASCFAAREFSLKAVVKSIAWLLVCGFSAALIIHLIYDLLLGPDPRRFSISYNFLTDTIVVLFNTLVFFLTRLLTSLLFRRRGSDSDSRTA